MSESPNKADEVLRKQIGSRIAEERARAGLTQEGFAAALGNSKRAVAAWEIGESMPKAEQLGRFQASGVDVLYVLLGTRGGALSFEESALIDLYKRIPIDKRSALHVTAQALAVGLPAPSEVVHGVKQVFNASVGTVQSLHDGSVNNNYTAAAAKTRARKGG